MGKAFNLSAEMEKAEKEFGGASSSWLQLKEGITKIRLLTPAIPLGRHYTNNTYETCVGKEPGCPWCKAGERPGTGWMCWVLDRSDDTIKPATLPYSVTAGIKDLQENPEWTFSEAPMPYDITITRRENNGKTEYSVTGSPKWEPVDPKVIEKLENETPIEQIKESIKAKQMKKLGLAEEEKGGEEKPQGLAGRYPDAEALNPADIPF